MRTKKPQDVVEAIEKRLNKMGEDGLLRVLAEQRVIRKQAAERENLIKAEHKLVRHDVRRALWAEHGLYPSASDSASASASASAS